MKTCVSSKTKNETVKLLTIKRINEVKTLVINIECYCKCKFHSKTDNSNQKWNNYKCQYECKKNIVWILVHVFVRTVNN